MKNLLKRHKEIVFLVGVAFVLGIASYDLFSDQQQNSGLINSDTTLAPSGFSGRVTCEVPIPSVESKKVSKGTNTLQEKLQANKSAKPNSTNN